MKVTNAIAQILKKEGVEWLIGYPVNPIIEGAAEADIRTIMVRQERIGLHMCDAVAKVTSADKIGVFVMQHGPGTEKRSAASRNPTAIPARWSCCRPATRATSTRYIRISTPRLNFRHVTKRASRSRSPTRRSRRCGAPSRRSRTAARPGAGRVPDRHPARGHPDALVADTRRRRACGAAPIRNRCRRSPRRWSRHAPVIVAGQGIHYAKAWPQLKALAELLEAPVMTTLPGKSAFPENHPLSLGSGGIGIGAHLWHFLQNADFIFGMAAASPARALPRRCRRERRWRTRPSTPMRSTGCAGRSGRVGDAGLTLDALFEEVNDRLQGRKRATGCRSHARIGGHREEWFGKSMHRLTSDGAPISPYQVVWDLLHTVDVKNRIIAHDAGGPATRFPFRSRDAVLLFGWARPQSSATGSASQ